MTYAQALAAGVRMLAAADVPDAPGDARRLLAFAAEVDPSRIILIGPDPIPADHQTRFDAALAQRMQRVPVSHIIGRRAFYGRDFAISGAALDPRPETEVLITAALAQPFTRLLDLGLGSGAIALTLLAERPDATGVGVDLSADACAIAAQNARLLSVVDRMQILQGSWFDPVGEDQFDLIVANPPYIALDEMPALAPELSYEPRMALTDEGDGLSAYRAITAQAHAFLRPGGHIFFEIGPSQGAAVSGMLQKSGFVAVQVLPDFDGRDRVVMGQNPL